MKLKKINNILYVFEKTPYKITKDLPSDYIYVDAYTFPGFKELNPELNLSPYNYNMLVIQLPEYYPYIDIPDTEIGKVLFDTSEENLVVITRGTVTNPPVGAEIKTYFTITIDGESTTDFFTTETYNLEIIEDYDGATLTAWTTAGDFEGETDEITVEYVNTDYSEQYLTFVALEDGTFTFGKSINYSLDNGDTWTALAANTASPTVTVGNKIMWKATLTPLSSTGIGTFSATGNFDVQGNPVSLIYGDNFKGQGYRKANTFIKLFFGNTKIKNAENLILPSMHERCCISMFEGCTGLITAPKLLATSLLISCYQNMFKGCSSLTTAPELPATKLAQSCYSYMFWNCTSLETAPELPATTLAQSCYNGMFSGCTSLTTAPVLPAETLAQSCYNGMFSGCTSLTTAPVLPAETLARLCYYYMFRDCTSLTTAPELSATTLASECCQYMFNGCTSLVNAPELPATTLADSCYSYMFLNCTSLTTAPSVLPATTLVYNCYNDMFYGCTSLTTAPELPATTLEDSCYSNMFNGCTSLNYIKAMFTTTPSTSYTGNWVQDVSPTGTFIKNAAATWDVTGNNSIPTGWIVETATE